MLASSCAGYNLFIVVVLYLIVTSYRWGAWNPKCQHKESSGCVCYRGEVQMVHNWNTVVSFWNWWSYMNRSLFRIGRIFRQNKISDLYSLFRLLRIEKFSDIQWFRENIELPIMERNQYAPRAHKLLKVWFQHVTFCSIQFQPFSGCTK